MLRADIDAFARAAMMLPRCRHFRFDDFYFDFRRCFAYDVARRRCRHDDAPLPRA